MYPRHDLMHSVIKRGIQNYTKQLAWDSFDKNWATSQCIMNSLVSGNETTQFSNFTAASSSPSSLSLLS